MICDRCCRPIRAGEGHERIPVDSASGAAPDLVRHERPCKAAPRQTAPEGDAVRRYG
ncbi:hypothetical protein [Streptomyces sp. NPDC005012]|uniref:hypothetical protein n=1 Tax=unclassified Streptomyces TaxID=2593676 RepID=UPI0033AAD9BD